MTNIDILKTELEAKQYADLVTAQNYPEIAALLNLKPLIDNPVPQQKVPKQLTLVDLFQAIAPKEALEIIKIPDFLNRVENSINSNDRISTGILLEVVKIFLSESSKSNLGNLLSLTIPDPNWQSQIPGISRSEELGIYPVNEMQVQSALN
jgi:hypothetical protein